MSFTNSSLISYTRISPNRNSPRNQPITKITIHHMAGVCSVEDFGNIVAPTARQMSANYAIGNDGRIGLFCPESDRSWCSGSAWNDNRAITIEVSNSAYGDASGWPISDAAYNSLIKLCVDICKRNGIKRLEFTGDQNGSLTYHYMFQATACPGPWIKSHTQDICNRVNSQLTKTTTTTTTNKPTNKISTVTYRIRKSWKDVSSQIGAYTNLDNAKAACKEGYTVYGANGKVMYSVPIKPKYKNITVAEVKDLQTILNAGGAGLIIDGIIGPKTQSAVKKYSIVSGDRGNLIRWVQKRLNTIGYSCGTADGIAGNKTMSALSQFQKDNKISGKFQGYQWEYLLK